MKYAIFTLLLLGATSSLFATTEKRQLQLQLEAPWGYRDQATIYFDLGVNTGYVANEDAPKAFITISGYPNIYSLTSDNVRCGVNGFSPLTQSAEIGIGLLIDSADDYTFSLKQFQGFDSTTLLILEDRALNVFTQMQVNFYQVHLTPTDTTGRFYLHVISPAQFSTLTSDCNNNSGAITVISDSSVSWNSISVFDSTNTLVASQSAVQGQFRFNGLPEGLYNVVFDYNDYVASKSIFVNGTYIVANFSSSTQNALVGETINFISNTINTTQYVWTFGDSTIETGVANPSYFYYEPGVYAVTMICSNSAGCTAEDQMQITVTEPTGVTNTAQKGISIINLGAKTIEVLMNDVVINMAELEVYNILGQSIYLSPITNSTMQVTLSDQPAGVYLVSVKNGGKNTTTKVHIN